MTNLISRKSSAHPSEPKVNDDLNRDHVRSMVRACLLRNRDIDETKRQVRRVYSYAYNLMPLVEHFFKVEVAQ